MARERISLSRDRMRVAQRRRLIQLGAIALAAVALIVVVVLLLTRGGGGGRDSVSTAAQATPTVAPDWSGETEAGGDAAEDIAGDEAGETLATAAPSAQDAAAVAARRAQTRPTPYAEGHAPIFSQAQTEEKIVAITVDDCYQADNLEQIVNKAIEVGGKLTIFPIGENVLKEKQSQVLKYAWEHGFELENHTFTHNGLYRCSDKEMCEEIYKQQMALSYILGVEYQPHFLRPRGGDARRDQRMHQYSMQLGYYGIAHWSASGNASHKSLARNLKPGAIYLFHTTDKDLKTLLEFLPWLVQQGYQLVTLNEMFGYPENETSELAVPVSQHTMPEMEPFEQVYLPLRKTSYSYYAYLIQKKLIELGYLKGEADGVYGASCEAAVKKYQKDHNLKVTGVADAALQAELIGS